MIFGAGGTGMQVFDIFRRNSVLVYGFLDDRKELHGKEIGEVTVLGDTGDGSFLDVIGNQCEAFIAISERPVRQRLTEMLQSRRKTMPVNAIHDKALVSSLAVIGHGNLIAAGTIIGPDVTAGHHNQFQTGALIEPFVTIGDFVNIGPGAIVNQGVTIESGAFIGAGAILVGGITIGRNARVGAGAVVIQDVAAETTVFGNPAAPI